jgi:excisionase family DNA binding protein
MQAKTAVNKGRSGMHANIVRTWLSYKEAEQLVGLSRTTLWKLLSAGEIEHRKVGRTVRINRESLEAYMRREAEGSATW